MGAPDNTTHGILTAPGPPVLFAHSTAQDDPYRSYIPVKPHAEHAEYTSDVLDLYDEEGHRQAWEDAVHLKELEIELRKAEQRVVPGVDNEDLEALLRSFDKQVQTVHSIPPAYDVHVPEGLDLHPAADAEFTVDGVRVALERLYTSVVVGLLRTVHEVQRIRHWEDEGYRSIVALLLYSYAWLHERILLLFLLFASFLILVPSSREYFFSPATYMDSTIDLAKLDPADPIRLAYDRQHNPWGAAATETSARDWANIVIDTVRSMVHPNTGGSQAKKVQGEVTGKVDERMKRSMDRKKRGSLNVADQSEFGSGGSGMGDKEREGEDAWSNKSEQDKVQETYLQPAMRVIQGLADKWERLANALDPSPSWALESRRGTVFVYLLPLLVLSIVMTERLVTRTLGFAFGMFMFGQPLLMHLKIELDQAWPTWKIDLILRANILETVPNNAQLILRILRHAEHASHPISFSPRQEGTLDDLESASDISMKDGSMNGHLPQDEEDSSRRDPQGLTKRVMHGLGSRMHRMADSSRARVRMMWDKVGEKKEASAAVLAGHREVDVAGKASNVLVKLHIRDTPLGEKTVRKLPDASAAVYPQKPDSFYVWHKKHGAGHLLLYPPSPDLSLPARIEFTTLRPDPVSQSMAIAHDSQVLGADSAYHDDLRAEAQRESGIEPVAVPSIRQSNENLIIPVNCIVGLRKTGLTFPVRVAVGWALDAEGAGGTGLDITFVPPVQALAVGDPVDGLDASGMDLDLTGGEGEEHLHKVAQGKEETIKLSGIVRRDELYRRLIAVGDQRWEVY